MPIRYAAEWRNTNAAVPSSRALRGSTSMFRLGRNTDGFLDSNVVSNRDVHKFDDVAKNTHHKESSPDGTHNSVKLPRVWLRALVQKLDALLIELGGCVESVSRVL